MDTPAFRCTLAFALLAVGMPATAQNVRYEYQEASLCRGRETGLDRCRGQPGCRRAGAALGGRVQIVFLFPARTWPGNADDFALRENGDRAGQVAQRRVLRRGCRTRGRTHLARGRRIR